MTEGTPDILRKILARKAEEIAERQSVLPMEALVEQLETSPQPRGFVAAIQQTLASGRAAVIAEAKKASPSKGVMREDFDIVQIARSYEAGGATCMSVLTDVDFFQGDDEFLRQARANCDLPLIRKDFIIDPYQVYEARVMGADCILLIVAELDDAKLAELTGLATQLELDVLIEVHDAEELHRALPLEMPLIGINNRNLRTFQTSLDTTINLLDQIPGHHIVVTESGINTRADVQFMREHGVNTFLVGETFMREPNPGNKLQELFV